MFKADPQLAGIPVVIVSLFADEERGLALGVANVLQKPVEREALLSALHGLRLQHTLSRQLTVLVVDDEPAAIELIAANLEGQDCRLLRAHDGGSAIRMAQQAQPDLIILDLLMPGMDGFQVLDFLRQDDQPVLAPVLVLTSKSLSAQDRERLNGRVMHVLEKGSFNRKVFLAEVQRALHGLQPPASASGNGRQRLQ